MQFKDLMVLGGGWWIQIWKQFRIIFSFFIWKQNRKIIVFVPELLSNGVQCA